MVWCLSCILTGLRVRSGRSTGSQKCRQQRCHHRRSRVLHRVIHNTCRPGDCHQSRNPWRQSKPELSQRGGFYRSRGRGPWLRELHFRNRIRDSRSHGFRMSGLEPHFHLPIDSRIWRRRLRHCQRDCSPEMWRPIDRRIQQTDWCRKRSHFLGEGLDHGWPLQLEIFSFFKFVNKQKDYKKCGRWLECYI